jgi:starch-binding outer membrane protein, SusD/RagB family
MKNFKTKKIAITCLMLVVFTISCKQDFLEVKPAGAISQTQLTSKAGLEGTLIGAYSMLSGRSASFYAGSTNWLWGSIMGGDANKGTNSGDQAQVNEIQAYNPQSTNESVASKYSNTYEGIARVNGLLRLLPQAEVTVTADDKKRIEAEGKFLRGHYYFELKKIFNNTPYIDETVDYAKGIEKVANDKDMWPMIEADLKFAYENLPETQSAPGRANKWAAGAYLAKAYLYQKTPAKYAAAKALFDNVIANGKTANDKKYGLVAKYGDLFRVANDNSEESVFAIQSASGTGTINNANPDFVLNFPYNGGPAGCCGFNQPSFDLANSFRTSNGLPLLDGSYNTGLNQLKNDQGVAADASYAPDAGTVDPRLDHSVGRRGIPYLDHGLHPGIAWIRDQNYGGPYAPKKFIWTKAEEGSGGVDKSSWTPGYSALNVMIIRFADVLLMAAEVEVELNGAGGLERARGYVNQVRARAKNPAGFVVNGNSAAANYSIELYSVPWTVQDDARKAVQFERKLELNGEGHRFFDLVRWDIASATLNAYLANERSKVPASPFAGASFTAKKSEYMPIPQREIDIVGTTILKQNPGY